MDGDGRLSEKIDGVIAVMIVGCLSKCERASPKRENGAKHGASNVVSDKYIMINWVGMVDGKDPSSSKGIVRKVAGPRRY